MAAVQNSYGNVKPEREKITKLKEAVTEVFRKRQYQCTCGENDYDILHWESDSIPHGEVQVNCKCCGRKHDFDEKRLSTYVGKHHG